MVLKGRSPKAKANESRGSISIVLTISVLWIFERYSTYINRQYVPVCGDERRNPRNISLDEEEVFCAVCRRRCSNGRFLFLFLFHDQIMDTSEKPGVIIALPK